MEGPTATGPGPGWPLHNPAKMDSKKARPLVGVQGAKPPGLTGWAAASGRGYSVRIARILLVLLAAVLATAALAAWQVPGWLDWNRYRSTIEVLASATLGTPVAIGGPISLALLPQPELTAEQVSVGDAADGDLSIRVHALRLQVALWPLLSGRVDARDLTLIGPRLHLPFPAGRKPGAAAPASVAGRLRRAYRGRQFDDR